MLDIYYITKSWLVLTRRMLLTQMPLKVGELHYVKIVMPKKANPFNSLGPLNLTVSTTFLNLVPAHSIHPLPWNLLPIIPTSTGRVHARNMDVEELSILSRGCL
jgi:hypothetical protein